MLFLQYNEFKCRLIREKVKTPTTTVYKWGEIIVLITGFRCTFLNYDDIFTDYF